MEGISYSAWITEVATGRQAGYHDVMPWDEEEDQEGNEQHVEFMWNDGNYSCDCNRELFFCRALGLNEPDDPKCGGERFRVKVIIEPSGKVIYEE